MSRAVITGAGAVSAFGIGRGALLDGLAGGLSAVGPIRSFDASRFPTRVAGEVPGPALTGGALHGALTGLTPRAGCDTWERRGLLRDRKVGFALIAAAEAWRDAGCGEDERQAPLSIGLGLEQAFLEDFAPIHHDGGLDWSREAAADLPAVRFRAPVDLAARCVTEVLGLRGATIVNTSACAAGTLAIAQGASLIARGAASVVIAGASDSMVNPLGVGGMSRLAAPSPRESPDACRPFDRRRDGLVIGEGAAFFVLESEERAAARGKRPLARVLGWASTQDAYRVTAPRPDGAATSAAMRRAIARAGLLPEDIDWVSAHGTGTPLNDPAEVRAIRAALGAHAERVMVSSIKGAVGHLMAACGALELVACLLAFERDLVPGTAHHHERDPECDLDIVGERPREARVDAILKSSAGFGGQNAALVLGRCP